MADRSRVSSSEPDPLVDGLVQIAFTVMAVLNRIGAENDLSLTQLRVLAILRDRRLRMTALADYLGLDKSTMTGLVARAEKRSLLRRAPNAADGRAVDVFISASGARLVDRLYAQAIGSLAALTDPLPVTDRHRLQAILDRMLGPDPLRGFAQGATGD